MARIAIVNNEKLKDMNKKKYIQGLCPVNRAGEECIYFEGPKLMIDESLCIGCGICANQAPEAIHVINLPEELDKDPIHRYGKNLFELFSLPTPIFGKVVGVLGRNGIGKSTAIKILAGTLKPNLGKDKEVTSKQLIEYFKGTEAQIFFEKLEKGEIKTAYKPQQIDLIPKAKKGKVIDLLKNVDEKGKLDEISEKLEIKEILENDIQTISGGELQRVAIAATVSKKANLYIFDEPTSYLDIKQRIKVSRFIKSLADENTSVLVVEHDLIILDYITDLVHIMYGKEDCYGIVSQPRATRSAINTYLSGFLKEENIRFREKAIKFEANLGSKETSSAELTGWDLIEKKMDKFKLKAEPGTIKREEVIGILGENGIGKTTFMRILAGELKADKGKIEKEVKISYKPQYLQSESEELVMVVLSDAIKKYSNQVINPLNIKPLLNKKLNELSGGELQRVSIALCLGKDADLYLLDEPSAYLDVEQRLLISKIIKDLMELKGKTALIVDHDLLFIDYLAHRLLVFEGIPAKKGLVKGPFLMDKGMNLFLEDLQITFRRDEESKRPRVNKEGSVKDREQKNKGKYYYS